MERSKLEKLIKKLEKLDIREWKYQNDASLIAEANGIEFKITPYDNYVLAKNIGNNSILIELSENTKDKDLKKSLKNLYDKTYESLLKYDMKQLAEKLDTFLSE